MVFFFFQFVYIVDYVDGFPYIKPSLHPWDEAYLVMMDDHFDVFLDSVCENFIENFCIDSHKGNCDKFLIRQKPFHLQGRVLSVSVTVASQNELGGVPSVSIL